MSRYIIILSTVIRTPVDLKRVSTAIEGFCEVTNWSIDLEDCDQIMRLDCSNDLGREIVECLRMVGVNSSVLEVFDENGASLPKRKYYQRDTAHPLLCTAIPGLIFN